MAVYYFREGIDLFFVVDKSIVKNHLKCMCLVVVSYPMKDFSVGALFSKSSYITNVESLQHYARVFTLHFEHSS